MKTMKTVTVKAEKHFIHPPRWALLERQLFDILNKSLDLILEKYLHPNGYFKWPPVVEEGVGYGAVDDAYESFHSWPLFYILGGESRFLTLALREFEAINEQFSKLPFGANNRMVVEDDYYSYCDWMHQGEGNQLFYLLNLADPGNKKLAELSVRFAALFLDDRNGNFDPRHQVFLSPVHGSAGPLLEDQDGPIPFGYASWLDYYGLPYFDVPGIRTLDDLKDPEKARLMGEVIARRNRRSDSVVNLMATSLMMNAYLHTHDEAYRRWILDYAGAWRERTRQNGGVVPDNAGPTGKVGELMDGKWYGGHYGWIWPHGYWFIAEAVAAAGENETLLTGDTGRMKWISGQAEQLLSHGIEADGTLMVPYKYTDDGVAIEYEPIDSLVRDEIFIEPTGDPAMDIDYSFREPREAQVDCELLSANKKFSRKKQVDGGWYEFFPLRPQSMAHAYNVTRDPADMEILDRSKNRKAGSGKRFAVPFFKNAGGQEYAWLAFLKGEFPDFPEKMLEYNLALVYTRLKKIHEDTQDPMTYNDSYIQQRNPICTEGLVHLTLGGPLPLYNGGLLLVTLLYYDADTDRPGLPPDVAALLVKNEKQSLTLTLVNLNPSRTRRLIVQGGAFGEHTFTEISHETKEGLSRTGVNAPRFTCELPPASIISLDIGIARYTQTPAYHPAIPE
ncbi:MAG: hypothetical protein LBD96_02420 [Treponema sp.]|nr:hypothetical protein [Treponema sp.]